MTIDGLSETAALALAASLATERLVLAVRSLPFLAFLNAEKPDAAADGWRRFAMQLLSLACAYVTAGFLAGPDWLPTARVALTDSGGMPVALFALLATGGSTFWKNILGYTKAVRDVRRETVRTARKQGSGGAEAALLAGAGGQGPMPSVRG